MRKFHQGWKEIPGEEVYPAYLAKRLAEFYERGEKVNALSNKQGSVAIIGAVSLLAAIFQSRFRKEHLDLQKHFGH